MSAIMVPSLKRETTRALCDVYTTLFDQETLLRASQSQTPSFGDETALPSPATTACTPGSTPCSDFDDFSLDLDEVLSPPTSPWLPTDVAVPADDSTLVSGNSKVSSGPGVNYMSLVNIMNDSGNGHSSTDAECTSPQTQQKSQISYGTDGSMFSSVDLHQVYEQQHVQPFSPHRQNTTSVAQAVRTAARSRVQGADFTETAAPSDLFNVSIDEILSSDPLKLTPEMQQMLDDNDFEMDDTTTFEPSQVQESNTLALVVPDYDTSSSLSSVGLNSSQETVQDDDGDFILSCESNDHSDMEFEDEPVVATSVKRKARRVGKGSSRPVKKSTLVKTPKVYPKRKPRESGSLEKRESKAPSSSSEDSHGNPDDGYRCELCPRERFGRIHDLKRHQVSKHYEMNWPCDFCRRPFVRRDALLRHYSVKSQRKDGIHPTADEKNRLSEARARAKLVA